MFKTQGSSAVNVFPETYFTEEGVGVPAWATPGKNNQTSQMCYLVWHYPSLWCPCPQADPRIDQS